jgi:predicted ATPase/class 3 adenylate cyclase
MITPVRAGLPTGTVTFLFTDIEGSTRLIGELGEGGYVEALTEHRRLLREAFGIHGGVEVDTQGDAFLYAFSDAAEAVAAAGRGQQVLAAGPVKVRMGLHSGEPLLTREGYAGRELHRAARIAAAGHGGQVVVSAATRTLVEDGELRELGEHRLKDFDTPVSIYQLGDGDFPPLKTISNTNLPRPVSSFVGREREVSEVTALLRNGSRLVTLTGPGGSGKTRLAIEAAAELLGDFRAGVFWVGLASLRDSGLVLQTVAQALGAKEELATHIGERELFLLLDNLEQVIDAAPGLAALLEACPKLRLLVTSRELLRVRGEFEYEVLPLEEPEAVELFCARAQVDSGPVVEELCRRLDNLPLALELAAARTKVLAPDQILERLSRRLDSLRGGRDADPRQATLRATIQWSHDLLDEHEQRLFRRLAVFAGGCTLEAAEEVLDAELDALQSLAEKSLIRFTGGRYWMLETIREFAAERLADASEEDLYSGRLLDWSLEFLRSVEPAVHGYDPACFDRIESEQDNARAALDYALRDARSSEQLELVALLGHFWVNSGQLEEGLRRAERVVAATHEEPLTWEKMWVTSSVGMFLKHLGKPREAIPWEERALEQSRELGVERGIAMTLHDLADNYVQLGDLERARELSLEALAIRERLGAPDGIAHALLTLPDIALLEGNLEEALAVCDRLASLVADDDSIWRRELDVVQAEVYRRCGHEERAAATLATAAEKALRTGGSYMVPELLLVSADLLTARAPTASAQLVAAAQRLCRETGYMIWPVLDSDRISAIVGATEVNELAADDALRLVLSCLD